MLILAATLQRTALMWRDMESHGKHGEGGWCTESEGQTSPDCWVKLSLPLIPTLTIQPWKHHLEKDFRWCLLKKNNHLGYNQMVMCWAVNSRLRCWPGSSSLLVFHMLGILIGWWMKKQTNYWLTLFVNLSDPLVRVRHWWFALG